MQGILWKTIVFSIKKSLKFSSTGLVTRILTIKQREHGAKRQIGIGSFFVFAENIGNGCAVVGELRLG